VYNDKPQAMIELKVRWDGPVDGLSEHRLSIGAFGSPLQKLLAAVRRTASNMLREATDRKETDTGRFFSEADQIDIQLTAITEGSTGVMSVVSVQVPPGQQSLWPEGLAEDAVDRVVQFIDYESRGNRRSKRVLEYLESLPPLTAHDYWLYIDGTLRREAHLGPLSLPTELDAVPYLVQVSGQVISVGFSPGPNFVRIKTSDGSDSNTFYCTPEHVNKALEMHAEGAEVRILAIVRGSGKRLLRIQFSREQHVRLSEDTWIFERWHNVLSRLAQ
jgi:hypothetical protein